MSNGLIKMASVPFFSKVLSPELNEKQIIEKIERLAGEQVSLAIFPYLCLSSSCCGDLFFQNTLLDGCLNSLDKIVKSTKDKQIVVILSLPIKNQNKLSIVFPVILNGEILGVYAKNSLTIDERKYFTPFEEEFINILGKDYPCGENLVFIDKIDGDFSFRIGDFLTKTSANVLIVEPNDNYSLLSKDFSLLAKANSIANTGATIVNVLGGESNSDNYYKPSQFLYENGEEILLNDGVGTLDLQVISTAKLNKGEEIKGEKKIFFSLNKKEIKNDRKYPKNPFLLENEREQDKRCFKILDVCSSAVANRLSLTGKVAVIGISGGLDSTIALLTLSMAMDKLGVDRKNIKAISMPCFATSERTKTNAQVICERLGVDFRVIDIGESVRLHLNDIGHKEEVKNNAYENAQARTRTMVLMNVSNDEKGIVIGTGDLSESALGWCTYNGDHMSMYNVNASLPKTLIQSVVSYYAKNCEDEILKNALLDIVDTPISPELVGGKDGISQKTEDIIGPYELHDNTIYYFVKQGFSPKKIYEIEKIALGHKYDNETILKWLKLFFKRFFTQQFKRSCMPDGVNATGISLSPREGFYFPSDAQAKLYFDELEGLE